MTRHTTDLDALARPAAPTLANLTQATAIEQARAVAEVQAAVTVAQAIPRDVQRAVAEMRDACGRLALAQRAFYSVPNRGNGPTVHLARELARIWGNIDYGVRELRRDDEELLAGLQFLHHRETAIAVAAERAFLLRLQGGCQVPIGAHAAVAGDTISLTGLIASVDGRQLLRDTVAGPLDQADALGTSLAETLLGRGGKAILDAVYGGEAATP